MSKTDEIIQMIVAEGRRPMRITVGEAMYDALDTEWDGLIEDPVTIFGVPVYWCKDLVGVDLEFAE